jgi:hypothetical protein
VRPGRSTPTAGGANGQVSAPEAADGPVPVISTEDPPTVDQVKTILEYVGKGGISSIIKGATDEKNALKKFHENPDTLLRPVVRSPETLDLYSQWQHTDTGPCRLWIGIMERQLREITSRRF